MYCIVVDVFGKTGRENVHVGRVELATLLEQEQHEERACSPTRPLEIINGSQMSENSHIVPSAETVLQQAP